MDFPTPPKGHKHERIHRHLLWPNKIDPIPQEMLAAMQAKKEQEEAEASED